MRTNSVKHKTHIMKKTLLFTVVLAFIAIAGNAQTDSTLKEYTGRYVFPEGSVVTDVTVMLDGTQLSMSSSAGTSQLTKLGVDSFTIVEFQGTAVFKRNEAKSIKSVHIEAAGYVLDGTRDEAQGWAFRSYRKPENPGHGE